MLKMALAWRAVVSQRLSHVPRNGALGLCNCMQCVRTSGNKLHCAAVRPSPSKGSQSETRLDVLVNWQAHKVLQACSESWEGHMPVRIAGSPHCAGQGVSL